MGFALEFLGCTGHSVLLTKNAPSLKKKYPPQQVVPGVTRDGFVCNSTSASESRGCICDVSLTHIAVFSLSAVDCSGSLGSKRSF